MPSRRGKRGSRTLHVHSTQSSHSAASIATPPLACFYVHCQLGLFFKSRFIGLWFRSARRHREIHPPVLNMCSKHGAKTPVDAQRPAGIFSSRGIDEVTQDYFQHLQARPFRWRARQRPLLGSVWPQALLQPGSHHRLAISVRLGARRLREAVGGPALNIGLRASAAPTANGCVRGRRWWPLIGGVLRQG
jgi:hypothetical protein